MIEVMKRAYCMFQDRTKIEIAHTETGRRAAAHQRRMFKHSQGFIIGRQILESGRNVFLTFADGWMLLNIIRNISQAMLRNCVAM